MRLGDRSLVNVLFFGTYDVNRHPRVAVLRDGLDAVGFTVAEINEPLGMSTASKVAALRHPWRVFGFGFRVLRLWWRLWRHGRRPVRPDVVIVGYMGHFDVHLAARRFRRSVLVLDQLVFAADTARDRAIGGRLTMRLLGVLDRAAIKRSDLVLVDTDENLKLVPAGLVDRALVVPVGVPDPWFREPRPQRGPPLRVVFFGLYTPLQGSPVVGDAIRLLAGKGIEFTMIGRGQDFEATYLAVGDTEGVSWIEWVEPADLPSIVGEHDVCLGIFGTGDKSERVVPNKVYQGAAAGCAVVTSDTPPQRRTLGADAVYVPGGDAGALAGALKALADAPNELQALRWAAYRHAERSFRPSVVVEALASGIDRALSTAAEK